MPKVVKVPKEKVEKVKKAKAVEKVVEKPAPKVKAEPKPKKTKKINKSAKDGKIVSKDFAKENPDTTFEQEVVLQPHSPNLDAPLPPPPSPMPVPDPTAKFFRNGDHIIEICGEVCTKHSVLNGVHCTEACEMVEPDGDELSRSEMFRELNG